MIVYFVGFVIDIFIVSIIYCFCYFYCSQGDALPPAQDPHGVVLHLWSLRPQLDPHSLMEEPGSFSLKVLATLTTLTTLTTLIFLTTLTNSRCRPNLLSPCCAPPSPSPTSSTWPASTGCSSRGSTSSYRCNTHHNTVRREVNLIYTRSSSLSPWSPSNTSTFFSLASVDQ